MPRRKNLKENREAKALFRNKLNKNKWLWFERRDEFDDN